MTVAELERLPNVAHEVELNFTDRQVSLKLTIPEEKRFWKWIQILYLPSFKSG